LGIPNTLVLGEFNIHGSFQRTGALTDEDGQATLAIEYTHFFKVMVLPPCGATATTPASLDATEEKRLHFGFAPQSARPGSAIVKFHLWEDRDGSGAREAGEGPLPSFPLYADPLPASAPDSGIYFGSLALQTDEEGAATLDLGNSCGEMLTPFRHGWNFTSFSQEPSSSDGGLWFPYGEGVTEVTLGLYPLPTPTPYTTWTPNPLNEK
jgi:hypothetical protein